MSVSCLRCDHKLEEYLFTRLDFLPHGVGHGYVMLECPGCGHVEFLSGKSPLLSELQPMATFVGDGD
jgi:hypothetical protein